jgi:hypothetical protein
MTTSEDSQPKLPAPSTTGSSMTAYLEVGPEVADFLGPNALAQARDAAAFRRFTCAICDRSGRIDDPDNPAALIAWRYLPAEMTCLRYAHASCSPSTILAVNACPALGNVGMAQACYMVSAEHNPPAALIIGNPSRLSALTGNGDLTDCYSAALLHLGLTLLTSCCQTVPPVAGLTVHINGAHVSVTAPGSRMLFDGLLDCPSQWLAAVRLDRRVSVMTAAGMELGELADTLPDDKMACLTALQHAINGGHAVAGTARIAITRRTLAEERAA